MWQTYGLFSAQNVFLKDTVNKPAARRLVTTGLPDCNASENGRVHLPAEVIRLKDMASAMGQKKPFAET